jgi:hypothetical protein
MQVTDTSLEDEYNKASVELYTEAKSYYKAALDGLEDIYESTEDLI